MTTSAKYSTISNATSSAKREMRVDNIGDAREQAIQHRQKEAAETKARTLAMYDNMAKSGNAGDKRPLDINTYRGKESGKLLVSGSALQKTDLVEETIRERVRRSEENKKRLLAAYDYAAKTQPAGTVRDVDLAAFQGVDGESSSTRSRDQSAQKGPLVERETTHSLTHLSFPADKNSVSSFEPEKPAGAATFRSSNGVPQVVKSKWAPSGRFVWSPASLSLDTLSTPPPPHNACLSHA
jgi:hypothetical protein